MVRHAARNSIFRPVILARKLRPDVDKVAAVKQT